MTGRIPDILLSLSQSYIVFPMNKEIIRTQIRDLLETINEQFEALDQYKETAIPRIEFDLVFDNIRKLYETMHLLRRMDDPTEHPVKTVSEQRPAPVFEPAPRVVQPSEHEPEREPVPAPPVEPEPDLFNSAEPMFKIKLQEAREQSLGPKQPQHLKSLITINDKFLFINELFDGNLREYNETIETLNGFKDRRQAAQFVDLVSTKNRWDPQSMAFRKLQELLEKKLG